MANNEEKLQKEINIKIVVKNEALASIISLRIFFLQFSIPTFILFIDSYSLNIDNEKNTVILLKIPMGSTGALRQTQYTEMMFQVVILIK